MIQNNLGGREETAMLGTKRGRSRRLPTPTPPRPKEVASLLHSNYNPTGQNPKEFLILEVVQRRVGDWQFNAKDRS